MLFNTAHVRAVSVREHPLPSSLFHSGPSIGSGQFPVILYYSKPCIYRATGLQAGLVTVLLKEPDYSLFRLLSLSCSCYPGQERPFLGFACRQRHIHVLLYSAGLVGLHNVEACSSGLCPE